MQEHDQRLISDETWREKARAPSLSSTSCRALAALLLSPNTARTEHSRGEGATVLGRDTTRVGQMDDRGRFDLVASISAALKVAEVQERDLIAALLQHALDMALREDAIPKVPREDDR